ncbi:MAG TPA: YeeE/YedE thiosulfate transporter family protein [Polyangiaceae bacterium]|nr:YeeE/YedE thiosulfate transporter family protein [Polyangiaceae bacterium]HMR75492.1 YeeE/YedE thiosulfate transporter family protein [Polyangiaceae bacterium]
MKQLILNGITPYHWAWGGAGVALVTLSLLYLTNKRLGVSTGFESVCSLVVKAPYFRRAALLSSNGWRLPMLVGLVLGGALSAVLGGGWAPTWNAGMLDTVFALGPAAKVALMFGGGLLVGFGTRLAGGCTSGHGIFGLSNFEPSGLVSTLSFMAAGVVTTNIVYRVLGAL